MKHAIVAVLTTGGLLALGACRTSATPSAAGTSTAAGVSAAPSTNTAATPPLTTPTPAAATPMIKKRKVTRKKAIPYTTRKVTDSALAKGTTKVRRHGVPGVKTLVYEITYRNGVQTSKKLIRVVISKAPVSRVVAVGTRRARRCDPNYSGACVPIASDVDCAGGGGNGPAYVQGPVRVVGSDIYDLDRDGDGIACDT